MESAIPILTPLHRPSLEAPVCAIESKGSVGMESGIESMVQTVPMEVFLLAVPALPAVAVVAIVAGSELAPPSPTTDWACSGMHILQTRDTFLTACILTCLLPFFNNSSPLRTSPQLCRGY